MRALIILSIWTQATGAILDLLALEDEEDAISLVKSASFDVKSVTEREVAGLIKRQWWEAAETLVLLSHEKNVDLSKHVREVVKQQRSKLDALVQKLDPRHATIQRISPAFQWAQNSSAVFLQIKYAARWNAPGALEADPLNVTFTDKHFFLDGMGAHSGVTKQYVLDLQLLDYIDTSRSSWATGSVGKLTVTLAKLYRGKVWPRLLLEKSKKISNMGVWSGMQEKQKESTPCQNSAHICASSGKLYCIKSDRCVPTDCAGCDDATAHESRCIGKPVVPTVGDVKDSNGERGKWSGQFTVSMTDESEVSEIIGYLSNESGLTKVEKELDSTETPPPEALFTIPSLGLDQYSVKIKDVKLGNDTNTLVVYARNALKRRGTPLLKPITDAAVPTVAPQGLEMRNILRKEDGNLTGTVWVVPSDESGIDGYNLYAGKSAKTRVNRKVLATLPRGGTSGKHDLNVKIGSGASHLLIFPKNHHGEGVVHFAQELPAVGKVYRPVPKLAPAAVDFQTQFRQADGNLAGEVIVQPPFDSDQQSHTTNYEVYAGKSATERVPNAEVLVKIPAQGAANVTGHVGTILHSSATHLLVYPTSEWGDGTTPAAVALPAVGTVKAEF
jgi:hypothetical protein